MTPRTIRGTRRPKVPPELPIALFRICGTGWAEEMSSWMLGRTNIKGIRKRRPANVLMKIVATMALGTWT
jgi:hypothetical protein